MNRLGEGVFRRVLRLEDALYPYEVRWRGTVEDARLHVSVPGARSARVREAVAHEVRRIFGLDFDLAGFYRMAKGDPVLADLVSALYGLRPTLAPGGLEMLVGSIIAQQVNLTFAFTLRARLVCRFGAPVTVDGDTVYAFPEARALARLRVPSLRAMQFSTRKAEYIRDVARAVMDGALDLAVLTTASNAGVIASLTALRGLGRWTADWYLARCLGRGDACPAGDLAVRKVFDRHYGRGRPLSEEAIRRRASAWGDYQTLAIHYLLVGMRLARPATGGDTAVNKKLTLPIVGQPDPNAPSDVHLVGRYAVGVTWADSHGSIYPFARLRQACPCGACAQLEVLTQAMGWPRDISKQPTGLRMTWTDEHQSFYPYPELRAACQCAACTGGH